jgi:hypothetical protein
MKPYLFSLCSNSGLEQHFDQKPASEQQKYPSSAEKSITPINSIGEHHGVCIFLLSFVPSQKRRTLLIKRVLDQTREEEPGMLQVIYPSARGCNRGYSLRRCWDMNVRTLTSSSSACGNLANASNTCFLHY